jgi:hypothetical protein
MSVHTIHDRSNFVNGEQLADLLLAEATEPRAGQDRQALSTNQQLKPAASRSPVRTAS